ncbi:cob(I)yrinic acid a,c-diamide adenosyltransferase [Romboutsia ilealis]|uniref:Corrinoid adenosyltransferase n=1 Tax=Romboutsia faecis TaxID=2764597 RepID=A0ABR7JKG2_9FIRM|nr:cob(I)yrinic acid a,c-diamide adenosyltransferase [Romboutsia faecis]MBC5995300.1 cob(I)yrinic acid a,c-diamide adenosyltransferase [Romboutsia faecis]MRN24455.1 cob(I)yrinic acid a,c-diamide adenosyltransferase [Romboutsia ilealis]
MKIYTRTGDKGQTSLYDGTRVDKDDIRVESYGTLDELNSYIGLCTLYAEGEDKKILKDLQLKLFSVSGELATKDVCKYKNTVNEEDIRHLENLIDNYIEKIDKIDAFIIPGSSLISANLHIARTICRRSERRIYTLSRVESVNPLLLKYINRLSDLLYAIARYNEKDLIYVKF